MRIWSLHPKYLDTKGLVALWRETLLAKHVLLGITKGYTNHPQLDRFKKSSNPNKAINQYLSYIYYEATRRGYNFDKNKIDWQFNEDKLPVTNGQLDYEKSHLLNKLKVRDKNKYSEIKDSNFDTHPMFELIDGNVESWERI